jgi:uncharacterized Zn finger protein
MWFGFERRKRRQVKGGIRASSRQGAIGKTWWAKRWIEVLESFNIGARLGRGKTYARQGQVRSIEIDKGEVTASVQGSRPSPYDVSISVKTLTDAEWKKVLDVLSGQAIFLAKLLAGEMPQDIEEVFKQAGLTLFPGKRHDLKTDCSCPDDSNPCKHIAAVYYLLGEEFDRDPFLLFRLRGMSREELLAQLGKAPTPGGVSEPAAPVLAPEPLSVDARVFWTGAEEAGTVASVGEVEVPPVSAALPKRLGNFPFWRGKERFLDALAPAYQSAAPQGLDVFLGEVKGPQQKTPKAAGRRKGGGKRSS